MALIKDSKAKTTSGNYDRLFGNADLGLLISKIQSAAIRSGNDLEKIIVNLSNNIVDLDEFIKKQPNGIFLVDKAVVKKSSLKSNKEPDFLIFHLDNNTRHCSVIELKIGDNFDTKKSAGEVKLLEEFKNNISDKISFTTSIHICCFNQNDKQKIISGFKNSITKEQAMTGMEFCQRLNLNYEDIIFEISKDAEPNINYFLDEILKIPECKKYIEQRLSIKT